jgi:hypothetical protein
MNLQILDIEKMENEIRNRENQILVEQGVNTASQCDEEGKQALKILHFIRVVLEAGKE